MDGVVGPAETDGVAADAKTASRRAAAASERVHERGIVGPAVDRARATVAASRAARRPAGAVRTVARSGTVARRGGSGEANRAAAEASAAEAASRSRLKQLQSALHRHRRRRIRPGNGGRRAPAAGARTGSPSTASSGPATWSVIGVSDQETLTPPPSALPAPTTPHHAASAAREASRGEALAAAQPPAASGRRRAAAIAVAQLQSALHLTADGEFGPETEAAITRPAGPPRPHRRRRRRTRDVERDRRQRRAAR